MLLGSERNGIEWCIIEFRGKYSIQNMREELALIALGDGGGCENF